MLREQHERPRQARGDRLVASEEKGLALVHQLLAGKLACIKCEKCHVPGDLKVGRRQERFVITKQE